MLSGDHRVRLNDKELEFLLELLEAQDSVPPKSNQDILCNNLANRFRSLVRGTYGKRHAVAK